jgi:hypothetical protein
VDVSKSALKDLEKLETRVRDRLGELAPLLEEWGELKAVADKLGIEVPALPGATVAAGETGQAKKRTRRPGRPKRKPRTDYAPLLEAKIKETPGLRTPRLADAVGDTGKSTTYRLVKRWRDNGTVEERDGGIYWTA